MSQMEGKKRLIEGEMMFVPGPPIVVSSLLKVRVTDAFHPMRASPAVVRKRLLVCAIHTVLVEAGTVASACLLRTPEGSECEPLGPALFWGLLRSVRHQQPTLCLSRKRIPTSIPIPIPLG